MKREVRQKIWGKPKARAHKTKDGTAVSPIWEYRGIKFRGRRNSGWSAGMTWHTIDPIGIPIQQHKLGLMVKIDRYLDERALHDQAVRHMTGGGGIDAERHDAQTRADWSSLDE